MSLAYNHLSDGEKLVLPNGEVYVLHNHNYFRILGNFDGNFTGFLRVPLLANNMLVAEKK